MLRNASAARARADETAKANAAAGAPTSAHARFAARQASTLGDAVNTTA